MFTQLSNGLFLVSRRTSHDTDVQWHAALYGLSDSPSREMSCHANLGRTHDLHCYVELLFLSRMRPRIRTVGPAWFVWRVMVWFVGGAFLYMCMAVTARALPGGAGFGMWWFGGLLLIGIELLVHTVLALREQPNFYCGTG